MLTQSQIHSTRRVNVALLISNAIGACVYVVGASHSWAIPEEHCTVPVTGEPFVWFAAVAPVVAVFAVVNMIWGVFILRRRQWQGGRLWLLAGLTWIVAIVIDFTHHC
jgi:hypothetical protein